VVLASEAVFELRPARHVGVGAAPVDVEAEAGATGGSDGLQPSAQRPAAGTGASASRPPATAAPPGAWRSADRFVYSRIASSLRYGEAATRSAFEAYASSLVAMARQYATVLAGPAAPAPSSGGSVPVPVVPASGPLSPTSATAALAPGVQAAAAPVTRPQAAPAPLAQLGGQLEVQAPRLAALITTHAYASAAVASSASAVDAAIEEQLRVAARRLRAPGTLSGAPFSPLPRLASLDGSVRLDGAAPSPVGTAGDASFDSYDAWQLRAQATRDAVLDFAGASTAAGCDTVGPAPAAAFYSELRAALAAGGAAAQVLFVSLCPEAAGGLHPLALGLLHNDVAVRGATAAILQLFAAHAWPPVRAAVASLNPVLLASLRRHAGLVGVAPASTSEAMPQPLATPYNTTGVV
jgi:hypothetical protein